MKPRAIIFGSIGALVETSDMQRDAFNEAFREAGLDWNWDRETYRELLRKPGGLSRIERYAADRGETVDARALHRRKTELFDRELLEGSLDLRPGVREVLDYAREAGIALGFATTTSRENVDATLAATTGQVTREMFGFVGDDSMTAKQKPAPDIYTIALEHLKVLAAEAIAIEDTVPCFMAARAAGIATVAFPNENAAPEGYPDALVITERLEPRFFTGG